MTTIPDLSRHEVTLTDGRRVMAWFNHTVNKWVAWADDYDYTSTGDPGPWSPHLIVSWVKAAKISPKDKAT